jgi:transposase
MSGKAAKIRLTERQLMVLQHMVKSKTTAERLVRRARLIVLAFDGLSNGAIGSRIGLERKQVGLWRRRWRASFDALVAIECRESHAALRRAIEDILGDAPRSGSPGKFTAEQVTQVLAVACEPTELSGRPIDTWTGRELAEELVGRGIVCSISTSQVNRYLAEAKLQPHRRKYWLNTTEKDPRVFSEQVRNVCQCYQEAPELYSQCHTHTICVDEMTGMQALERNAETIPMKPGQPARIEFEYSRHGTLCLTGNWHVVEGRGRLGVRRGQLEHTLEREPGTICGVPGGHRPKHAGQERQVGHPPVGGQSPGVSFRPESPHPLRVPAETQFVAESDRDRVRHCHPACSATRQLPFD